MTHRNQSINIQNTKVEFSPKRGSLDLRACKQSKEAFGLFFELPNSKKGPKRRRLGALTKLCKLLFCLEKAYKKDVATLPSPPSLKTSIHNTGCRIK